MLFGAAVAVVLFWMVFILHDLIWVGSIVDDPMWMNLFTPGRPIEWLQWLLLVPAVVLAGHLAGRLTGGVARFFLLISFGMALIFVADASDLRYMLYIEYTSALLGREFLGVSTWVLTDIGYSILSMLLAVYAVFRYGDYVWPANRAFTYLLAGFGIYVATTLLYALRHMDDLYQRIGEQIDAWLLFGRWPATGAVADDAANFSLVDSVIRETLEVFGAAFFLAMVLAFAAYYRRNDPESIEQSTNPDSAASDIWPAIYRLNGLTVFLVVVGLLALSWVGVVLLDLIRVSDSWDRPLWEQLFHNNRPAEWAQWTLLLVGAVLSAFLSARLSGDPARFFFLMGFGLILIFFEDTSDLRHTFYREYLSPGLGDTIAGIPTRVIGNSIYFSLIASIPVYALVRYGRSVWDSLPTRNFMLAGFGVYAMAGGLSALSQLGDLYIRLGEVINTRVFASRWPWPETMSEDRAHFYVMDSLIEESIELLGAACLLAMVLSYAWHHRNKTIRPDDEYR